MQLRLWTPAYVAIGSNLANPLVQVLRGFDALAGIPDTLLVRRSRLYRTAPLGPQDQPDFINAAVGVLTRLDAGTLLGRLKDLESQMGRDRTVQRWGPRVIDFDLLVFGQLQMSDPVLTLPHPGIAERAFVLYPLRDIAPDLDVPGHGPVRQLAARVPAGGIEPIVDERQNQA